jgi:hypothetical protein
MERQCGRLVPLANGQGHLSSYSQISLDCVHKQKLQAHPVLISCKHGIGIKTQLNILTRMETGN